MYVFLDTETTGLPKRASAMVASVRQWPRLVQVAWAAYEKSGSRLAVESHLVYPSDFAIPAAAARIHGISTSRAKSEGVALGWVMDRFLRAMREYGRMLVGHNVGFDRNVIAAEMYRLGYSKATVLLTLGIFPSREDFDGLTPFFCCSYAGSYAATGVSWRTVARSAVRTAVMTVRPAGVTW